MKPIARAIKTPSAWVLTLVFFLAIAANSTTWNGGLSSGRSLAEEHPSAGLAKSQSMREGAVLPDQVGHFKIASERVQFEDSDSGRTFRCLENLMLQRVYQVISEEATPSSWIVSGKATEYRGENFLLIEAVRRTK